MRRTLVLTALAFGGAVYLCAQSEADLRDSFEGRTVVVKQDLPASKTGIDIFPDSSTPINYADYGRRIKQFGVAIRRNQSVPLTSVRVNDKSIELQLGGSATAEADNASPAASVAVEKSPRERALERDIQNEADPERQAKMQQELDTLRRQRQREDARLKAALAQLASSTDDRQRAAAAVSHINLLFPGGVPARALNPDYVKSALRSWIDFPAVERPIASTTAPSDDNFPAAGLHKGMTETELVHLYGAPVKRETGTEGDLRVEILTFKRDGSTLEATMVEGVLVRFRQWSD
ncbi:MAG: hypothetical protein DMG64_15120 [Acidobacteria bacterium]|nr:MAG: hypothetical protein DMG64_15120 [Acidobacteriota bacterium]